MAGSIELAKAVTAPHPGENALSGDAPKKPVTPAVQRTAGGETTVPLSTVAQDKQAMTQVADALNQATKLTNTNLSFSVDQDSGRIVVKVMNGETGEVIRQIPADDLLKASQDSHGSLAGLLFSSRS